MENTKVDSLVAKNACLLEKIEEKNEEIKNLHQRISGFNVLATGLEKVVEKKVEENKKLREKVSALQRENDLLQENYNFFLQWIS